jgi:hypothetical protein
MKSKKSKKFKKLKLNIFQEVDFKMESFEMKMLILICAVIFGISSFGSGKLLYDYSQKKERNILSSKPEVQIINSVIAAENQTDEDNPSAEDYLIPEENKEPETMFIEVDPEKDLTVKEERAKIAGERIKIIARQRAAEIAQINSAPVLAGQTKKLPDGKRICPVKSEHPQRGGKTHIDEDCCADYNEYPNPRCYYPPSKMAILKKR